MGSTSSLARSFAENPLARPSFLSSFPSTSNKLYPVPFSQFAGSRTTQHPQATYPQIPSRSPTLASSCHLTRPFRRPSSRPTVIRTKITPRTIRATRKTQPWRSRPRARFANSVPHAGRTAQPPMHSPSGRRPCATSMSTRFYPTTQRQGSKTSSTPCVRHCYSTRPSQHSRHLAASRAHASRSTPRITH